MPIVAVLTSAVKGLPHVRFGSKADMCSAKRHVRFTPESDAKCVHSNVRLEARPASGQVVVNDLTENHRLLMTTRDAGL